MYHITLYDGDTYEISDQEADVVKSAMIAKEMVQVGSTVFSATAIKKLAPANRFGPENTSQLSLEASDVFGIEAGIQASPPSFWKEVLMLNKQRKGKHTWYFAPAVEWGRRESGFSEPKDIFAFLDTEPSAIAGINRPDIRFLEHKKWVREESKRFFGSEPGIAYRMLIRLMDLDRVRTA